VPVKLNVYHDIPFSSVESNTIVPDATGVSVVSSIERVGVRIADGNAIRIIIDFVKFLRTVWLH
jgi:hypothetical protein